MRKIVYKFGLIAGTILSAVMLATFPFWEKSEFDHSEVIGYASMVGAFLLIFFGVRAYRDTISAGRVSFGRALTVGALIAVVGSVCYVATWEFIYFKFMPDFAIQYRAHVLDKARANGETEAAISQKTKEMDDFVKMYSNPLFNVAMTFAEPMPVGLIIAFVTAGVLSRRKGAREEDVAPGVRAPA